MNLKFERNKLIRGLKQSGKEYQILRDIKNEFEEPTGESEEICTLKAIYHEKSEYVKVQADTAAIYRSKKQPMLLCLHEDTPLVKYGDYVVINDKRFVITAITNIMEWGIAADISLEVLDCGD